MIPKLIIYLYKVTMERLVDFTEQSGYLLGNHQLFISFDDEQSNLALWGTYFSGAAAAAIYIIELLVNSDSQEGKIILERLSYQSCRKMEIGERSNIYLQFFSV